MAENELPDLVILLVCTCIAASAHSEDELSVRPLIHSIANVLRVNSDQYSGKATDTW